MRIRSLAIAVATVTLARLAPAQSVGNMLKDDFKNAGKDILSIWASPFDASGRDWMLTGAAFGAFGLSMLADQEAGDWAIRNDSSAVFRAIGPLRRRGVLYSGKYVVPPVAAVYVLGIVLKNQGMRDFVMGCASSWAAQSAVRKGVYRLVGRERPDTAPATTAGDPHRWSFPGSSDWSAHSFPAGHFANAMACATYWNKRFEFGPVEPALYGVAAAVGVGRMADRGHWLSDTVLGGILGYAVGSEVARRSLARQRDAGLPGASTGAFISPGQDGVTLGMRWTF